MWVRTVVATITLATLGLLLVEEGQARADPAVTGYPDSIASLGDSITRAANSAGLGDFPEYAWSTGTNGSVNPYYSRLLAAHPPISGNRYNDAVSGARMTHLDGQAQSAVSQGAELVFVLMGANDVCTSSEGTMTQVATFQTQFETAMETLSTGLPDSRIAVLSIPDIYNLWDILHGNSTATSRWDAFNICQSMLENPTSTAPADVQRRANVRQRNVDFNDVLHDVCAQYAHCKFDDYLGFDTAFTPADVSTLDYFHPSVAGQALIAQLAWDNAFDWTDTTPPVSDSQGVKAGANVDVTLSATDASGVLGVEYHLGGPWINYDGSVSLSEDDVITWRAVDDEGNTETTRSCRVGDWSWPNGDDDCDGWMTAEETYFGTDETDACGFIAGGTTPSETWPADLAPSNDINIADALALKAPFGQSVPLVSPRLDLALGGTINIADVLTLKPVFGGSCTP
jgi:lysophospholipase L1-like esterase